MKEHVIREGESLDMIAKDNKITVENIIEDNKITDRKRLGVGNVLLIRESENDGKSKKNDPLPFIYHASCKSSTSPAQKKGEYDIHDVLEIDPGVGFSFFTSYYTLKDPYFHDDTLVEEATREDVMIFLKKYQVKYT